MDDVRVDLMSVSISPELKERITQAAKQMRRSRSQVVTFAIEAYLRERTQKLRQDGGCSCRGNGDGVGTYADIDDPHVIRKKRALLWAPRWPRGHPPPLNGLRRLYH